MESACYYNNCSNCNELYTLTGEEGSKDRPTPASISNSILWGNCEVVDMMNTGVVSSKGIACVSEIETVSTGDGSGAVLICHISDEDSVPDVRFHPCHIQGKWRIPGKGDKVSAVGNVYLSY